jgi:hypothetical protein
LHVLRHRIAGEIHVLRIIICVDERGNHPDKGKQAHMGPIKGNVKWQLKKLVVTRQVSRPKEAGLSEFDGSWKKPVEGKPYRHLQNHRKTPAKGIHAKLPVHFHRFHLLLLLILLELILQLCELRL